MRTSVRMHYLPGGKTILSVRFAGTKNSHSAGTVVMKEVNFASSGMLSDNVEEWDNPIFPRQRDEMLSPYYWPEVVYNQRDRCYVDRDTREVVKSASFVYATSDGKIRYFKLGY